MKGCRTLSMSKTEEDLARLDELELVEMTAQGRAAKRLNETLTQTEVKRHLNRLHQRNDTSQPTMPVKRSAAKKRSVTKKR